MDRGARDVTVLRGALILALCGCASTAGSTAADAAAARLDASCSGNRVPTEALGVDPLTRCPREVVVTHRWTSRRVCERVEPACEAPPACRFEVRLVAPALPGCAAPGIDARYPLCRCEFGVVECPTRAAVVGEWPGCVNNSAICYNCDG